MTKKIKKTPAEIIARRLGTQPMSMTNVKKFLRKRGISQSLPSGLFK